METSLERLIAEALMMPAKDRAVFAQLLLESLQPDREYDGAWELEIERRIAEIDNGTTKLVPMEDALAKVRSTLK